MTEALVKVEPQYLAATDALEAQERAAIDIQIATAKRYPRTMSMVREKVLELATIDQSTAAECWYSLPREGKVISGPGVRLAEIVASSYGNLRTATRVVAIDEKHVTAQGVCHDLETNNAVSVEVKRRITNKYGKRYGDDMVMVTANAACAIALRNAVFKVVPGALLHDVFQKVKQVGMGDERTLAETREAIFAYFKGLGIDEKRVLGTVSKRAREDVTLEDAATLRGLATAIKEGTTTVEESFPKPKGDSPLAAGRHEKKGGGGEGGAGNPPEARQGEAAPELPPVSEQEPAPEAEIGDVVLFSKEPVMQARPKYVLVATVGSAPVGRHQTIEGRYYCGGCDAELGDDGSTCAHLEAYKAKLAEGDDGAE